MHFGKWGIFSVDHKLEVNLLDKSLSVPTSEFVKVNYHIMPFIVDGSFKSYIAWNILKNI